MVPDVRGRLGTHNYVVAMDLATHSSKAHFMCVFAVETPRPE